MKTLTSAILMFALAGVLASCSGKSAEDELADRFLNKVMKKAGEIDLKKIEAEGARLTNQLSPEDRAKAKEALKKLGERL